MIPWFMRSEHVTAMEVFLIGLCCKPRYVDHYVELRIPKPEYL